jgi:hypothetical protein
MRVYMCVCVRARVCARACVYCNVYILCTLQTNYFIVFSKTFILVNVIIIVIVAYEVSTFFMWIIMLVHYM